MATNTITSDKQKTKVGSPGTDIYTSTKTEYETDSTGKIISSKTTLVYYAAPLDPGQDAAVSIDGGKTWKYNTKPGSLNNTPILGTDAQKSLKEGALKTTTQQQIKTSATKKGLTTEQQKALKAESNTAITNPNDVEVKAEDAKKDITNELADAKKRDAKTYDNLLVYPENLQLEYQDCIKFSMVEYIQPGLTPGASGEVNRSVVVQDGIPKLGTREILSTIVLPIPGGISDSNGVDWQADSLDGITEAFAKIAQESITKGATGVEGSVGQVSKEAEKNVGALKVTLASKFTELATGSSRIMQRQYGAAPNPNLELLFNGPQLRSFSFTFRLSPRSESEAVKVKKIIRYFKQGMTPKRSKGYLLLQSPYTFAISYITSNKEHPYLNRFKECALTQCNVNYTPEGNYMSYDGKERSMTSYELSLQFQELVPLFDDDYGSSDTNIGF